MGDLSLNHCVQILTLQSAVEEFQLSEKQLKHKLEVQAEMLSSKMEELRALNENTQSSMMTEMMEVQLKTMELESAKVRLGEAHLDSRARVLLVGTEPETDSCWSRWSWSRPCRRVATEGSSWS